MTTERLGKVKAIAMSPHAPERSNASRILAKHGVYVDIATIEWEREKLELFSEKKRTFLFGFDPLKPYPKK